MNRSVLWISAALLVLLPSIANAKPKRLDKVSLAFTPTTIIGEKDPINLTGLLKTRIQLGEFTDTRSNPALIAENREDADKGKILAVTTKDDVAAWVKVQVGDLLGKFGLSVVPTGGDVVISGEIRRFFVNETSTYQADVGILITVKDAAGVELWQGMANGSAERFGRSYKLENYAESWSDALLEATYSLLSSAEFRQTLAKK